MELQGLSLIGYGPARPQGKATAPIDPATGATLEPGYHWATRDDVDAACALAARAFETYRAVAAPQRADVLRKIADGIEARRDEIVARAGKETALPAARLNGELARTTSQLRLFAQLVEDGWWLDARIDRGDPARQPLPKPDVRSMLVPLGPVAVFSSSNFPLAFSVAGGDTASALAAGCPVVVKPHQGHLGTSELIGRIVQEVARTSGMPEGVFSMLYGPGREVGLALVTHAEIRAVGFTGSRSGGRALMDAAAARPSPIPVYAEMGSINPVFLLPGALKERAEAIAEGLHASVTLGVGQFCTNPGLVFVPEGPDADRFVDALAASMGGTPTGAMLTPSICEEYREGVERFAGLAGVETLARVEPGGGPGLRAGAAVFRTTAEAFAAEPRLSDELFGPSTLVVVCPSAGTMRDLAARLDGQLTATIHATEAELVEQADLLAAVVERAGRVVFNGFPTGVEVCHAMHHGGPYPATSDGRTTSVGTRAIMRFARPACYQNIPPALLPPELRDGNPLAIWRLVDGAWTRA